MIVPIMVTYIFGSLFIGGCLAIGSMMLPVGSKMERAVFRVAGVFYIPPLILALAILFGAIVVKSWA